MKQKIYAMIPARIGSTRLKMKNLALINGKPMISYAIQAAKDSGIFDRIVLNSDSELFARIAERYGVEFYLRPERLGGSNIKSDDVVLDFIKKHQTDIVAWVNPISPLQTGDEIRSVISYFQHQNLNSLITVIDRQSHCVHDQKPVNFRLEGKFEQTQDLIPVEEMVYSIMMWRSDSFIEAMNAKGHAILHGKVGYYPVNKLSGFIVKTAQDLKLIDFILRFIDSFEKDIEYDNLIDPLRI